MNAPAQRAPGLDVFLIAAETSADVLGAGLMRALTRLTSGRASFRGVGGPRMQAEGLVSLCPMQDLSVIGIAPLIHKLPTIARRLREIVGAIAARPPDVLVLIDAPDFTLRVAARVRRRVPHLKIVKYVSPSVWAWRPGRAKAMRPYIDLVLALLPFEPEVHRKLGGPPCRYVGHPLLDRLSELRPSPAEAERRLASPPLILALPGSRPQEIHRLGALFGEVFGLVAQRVGPLEIILPTMANVADQVASVTAHWPIRPRIVTDEAEKHAAFRRARAALAASGTVTLELALAGIPQVVGYRIPLVEGWIVRAVTPIHSVVLANLILGDNTIPEFLQTDCKAANLAPALAEIVAATPARQIQLEAFRRLDAIMGAGGVSPSERAASAILELAPSPSS